MIKLLIDVFTKGLPSARFLTLKNKLLVVSPPINLRGGVKVYQALKSLRIEDMRSIAPSSAGLVALTEKDGGKLEDLRLIALSRVGSVALTEKGGGKSEDLCSITPSSARSVALIEKGEKTERSTTIDHSLYAIERRLVYKSFSQLKKI